MIPVDEDSDEFEWEDDMDLDKTLNQIDDPKGNDSRYFIADSYSLIIYQLLLLSLLLG